MSGWTCQHCQSTNIPDAIQHDKVCEGPSQSGITVYVAARFPTQAQAKNLARLLEAEGISNTSRWLNEEPGLEETLTDKQRVQLAAMDLYDVRRAHALVLWNPEEWLKKGGGGCHVETGFALAMGVPVFLYGPRSNIFHYLPDVTRVLNVAGLVEALKNRFSNDGDKAMQKVRR